MEGWINLYKNDDTSGNRPHYKVTFKIDDVWHEAVLWPAKDGKKGFSGKFKPQEKRVDKKTQETLDTMKQSVEPTGALLDDSIPFSWRRWSF